MTRAKDELLHALDDMDLRSAWGIEENADGPAAAFPADRFAIPKIITLVAGFSNACHLRCPFCYEEHYGRDSMRVQNLDMDRLIRLIRSHRAETGSNIEYFRIGNTGEPLIHKDLSRLITSTEECVNWFSVISSLSLRDRKVLDFLGRHHKVKMIHVSCDASDPVTYGKIRINGDFEAVWSNIDHLKSMGKYIVLNAVAFEMNMESLLGLPDRMAAHGVDELHLFYPLNTNEWLHTHRLHKPPLHEYREFLLRMREKCGKHSILFRTDPWAFHPEMIGVIPDIETPAMYEQYTRMPCDWLWLLILHPDGTFHNCSVLNTLGGDLPPEARPFNTAKSLLDLANREEVLAFRKLQFSGLFPAPCRKICHKRSIPRPEAEVNLLYSLYYGTNSPEVDAEEFASTLLQRGRKIVVRAFSANVREFLAAHPRLAERVECVVDRDKNLDCPFPVEGPEFFEQSGHRVITLLGSTRSSVIQHAVEHASYFEELHRIVVIGEDAAQFKVQRLI